MEGNPDPSDGKKALWWRPLVLLAVIATIFLTRIPSLKS